MTNDADGRMLTAARSNGVDTNYTYDDAGRLTGVGHTGPNGGIDGFSYMLDPNGNRTAVMSNAGTETYTLDALNRLTNVTYPGALSETFEYDAAGNRTSHTKTDGTTVGFTVDATGQLISDTSGTTYTYDAAGNLTGTSDGEAYTYDDYGRHTSISAGGVTQTYGYDAANVRVTVDGVSQLWDRNGGLPTLISTSGGDNYVHTAGVSRDGDGWLLADAVGSVRTVVDNTGAATGTQSFTAFGEQLSGSGTFGFAGEQQDPTGLQHLRARQYNPALGRFTTVDPIQPGAPGTTGYNLYAYSGNNPITWTDPSGQAVLVEYSVKRAAVAGAVGGALTPWTCKREDSTSRFYQPDSIGSLDARCAATQILTSAALGAFGFASNATGLAKFAQLCGANAAVGALEGALVGAFGGDGVSATGIGVGAVFGCVFGAAFDWSNQYGPNSPVGVRPAWTSSDKYVGPAANAIEAAFPGRILSLNTNVNHTTRSGFREIDILLDTVWIQVKHGKNSGSVIQQIKDTMRDVPGTPVIGFTPDISNRAWVMAAEQGIPIARTIDELLAMIEELG